MRLTDWIYIYFVDKEDRVVYDRSVSRRGLGPPSAKQRVEELKKHGYEAFYTIGFVVKGALS